MLLQIPRDYFDNPIQPRLFLCQTDKSIIGELRAYNESLNGKWNTYSELNFTINRRYDDAITGEQKIDPLFDLAEGLRIVKVEGIGYFQIQDPDTTYSDSETKILNCFSLEYTTSQKYLESFYINTGADESQEVTYWANLYGNDYWNQDNYYKRASNTFDAYTRYYIKDYTDNDSYTYTEVSISNATEFATYDASTVAKTLYVKSYPNVQFYNPTIPQLSLLHIVFAKIPEWSIGNVDYSLRKQERKFEEERVSVYDFLINNVSDTFKCVVEWDTNTNTVNFYEEAEDGITEDNTVQSDFDTDIYISRENLANEINIKYSTDNIKTKLKVSGGDDMDIRDVNIGQNYIMNLDYYHTVDWMGQELYSKYAQYKTLIDTTKPQYTEAMQKWVGAYNIWNDLMNAVPAERNVLLVGDSFEKLYCTYGNIRATGYVNNINYYDDIKCESGSLSNPQPTINTNFRANTYYVKIENALTRLANKLELYCAKKDTATTETRDTEGTLKDNVLLTLRKSDNETATIRVYYDTASSAYKVRCTATNTISSGTMSIDHDFTLSKWINHEITASSVTFNAGNTLEGYKITAIGTLGAYLCLVKDETQEANLQDYGIKLLEEKQATYTTIFTTQTEGLFAKEKYKCIASDTPPDSIIEEGSFWLDTDSSNAKLYRYNQNVQNTEYTNWELISGVSGLSNPDYADYARYIENYTKLQTVQKVLAEKKKEAEMYLNGIQIEGIYLDEDHRTEFYFRKAAEQYFGVTPMYVRFDYYNDRANTYIGGVTYYTDKECRTEANPQPNINTNFKINVYYMKKVYRYAFFISGTQQLLTEQPDDWSTNYKSYWTSNNYIQLVQQNEGYPTWRENTFYSLSSGVYTLTTSQPNNWTTNYYNYYMKTFAQVTGNSAPVWTNNIYYKMQVYIIYLNGNAPYVAYENSQGTNLAQMNHLKSITNMENYFTAGEWMRLSAFIREDEFSDSNVALTGYESEEERISLCNELVQLAEKELKTLSQPSLEFSMTMANILALPEFTPIKNQFKLGNFVRIGLPNNMIKRARLLECNIDFDDLSSFSCTFGNLVTTQDQIDIFAELQKQSIEAGKTVASNASNWQKAVDKANSIDKAIQNGLADATLNVGKANGQSIEIGQYGIWGRKLVEGATDQWEPEQFRILNNKLVFSSDGFQTSKALFGKYTINGEERWGILSEYVDSGVITGSTVLGGSLKIGDYNNPNGTYFMVDENGNVSIRKNGSTAYADAEVVAEIENARQYHIELVYSNSTVFNQPNQSCQITAKVYKWDTDITSQLPSGTKYSWIRNSSSDDTTWNTNHANQSTNIITITNADVNNSAQFSCQVNFDDTNL